MKPVVAIIGGGFSGAAVAYHLAQMAGDRVRIVVIEPRAVLGAGLAYSTDDPVHRINVPAARMSLLPDDELHFARWLEADGALLDDPAATLPDGRSFPARRHFGRYVTAQLADALADGRIQHIRAAVQQVDLRGKSWCLTVESTVPLVADIVVIATSHPPPSPPGALVAALTGHPKFIPNPWASAALDPIASDDHVLIVGTGLTMADVIASLDARGHRGPITAISRRGQRSHGHAPLPVAPFGDFTAPPSTTALGLLRRIRAEVRAASRSGRSWHGLFDTLRKQGGPIWRALPRYERQRLIRHLRPFWDTHRFRIAPQIEAVLDRRVANGTLTIKAASVTSAAIEDDQIRIALRNRQGGVSENLFHAVITTTGPSHGEIVSAQMFLTGLAAQRLIKADPLGLGILVDQGSWALDQSGRVLPMAVAGPLARGTFGELMGLPEVSHHAFLVAEGIVQKLLH